MITRSAFVATVTLMAVLTWGCGSDAVNTNDVNDTTVNDVATDNGTPDSGTPDAVADARDTGTDQTAPDADATVVTDTNEADATGDAFVKPDHLPTSLPIEFTRPQVGDPLTPEEVTDFTVKLTGFLKQINYFKWVYDLSTGIDASSGKPDYMVWWHDVDVIKEGNKLTFDHCTAGGAHNIMIPTSEVLGAAISDYFLTDDPYAARVVEQYCKGITATMKGFLYDSDDQNIYLMARNFFGQNHEWTLEDGRQKAVDFTRCYSSYSDWNAERFEYTNNPIWGDIWVTNLRSKDDVCHIFRTAAFLPYAVQNATDTGIKTACAETLEYLKGFSKDIVDYGYNIRTKDELGVAYLPGCENEKDLSSFVCFIGADDQNECTSRVSTALIAYGDTQGVDCKSGFNTVYDQFSQITHCFNYHINWNFHMAAVANALTNWELDMARGLMGGLAQRADTVLHPSDDEPGAKNCNDYQEEGAQVLAMTASVGLPLTNEEVRHIHKIWNRSVDNYLTWTWWDMWDESVPDGVYPYHGAGSYRPKTTEFVDEDGKTRRLQIPIEDMAILLEYCYSPLVNPTGAPLVDCEIIRDVTKWGVGK
jgi:hypothetical protein